MAGALGSLNILLGLDTAKFTSALSKTDYQSQNFARKFTKNMQSIDASADKAARAISGIRTSMQTVVALSAGAFSAREVLRYADGYTELQNRLRLVTKSTDELKTATSAVFDIALRTNQGIDATSTVFQRFAQNADSLGISLGDVAGLTDTVSKAIAISGGSAASAEAALVQFGQALASGVLRGEELNSVMEQAPGLAQAIARGLDVPIGSLRALSAEGKITSDALVQALQTSAESVDQDFSTRVITVSQAFTNLSTSASQFIGEANEGVGVTWVLAGSIDLLARNLDLLGNAVFIAGAGFAGMKAATIAPALFQMGSAAAVATTGFVRQQVATIALTGAMGGARSVALGLTAALRGFALTPVGLALLAASAAFVYLTSSQNDNKKSLDDLSLSLDDYIDKLKENTRVELQSAEVSLNASIEAQKKALSNAFNGFSLGGRNAAVSQQFKEIAENTALSADEMSEAFSSLIERSASTSVSLERQKDKMIEMAASAVEGRKKLDDLESRQKAVKGAMDGTTSAAGRNTTAMQANAKAVADAQKEYDKLIASLKEQTATFGLDGSGLARYKAQVLGVADAQVELAALQGRQVELLERVKESVQEGNNAAQAAAQREYQANADRISQLERMGQLEKARADAAKYASDLSAEGVKKYIAAQNQIAALSSVNTSSVGLRIKGAQATGGGSTNGAVFAVAQMLQQMQGSNLRHFASFNDNFHAGTSSKHASGLAFDASLVNGAAGAAQAVKDLTAQLEALGLTAGKDFKIIDEYANPSKNATGGHLHFQFQSAAAASRLGGTDAALSQAIDAGRLERNKKLSEFELAAVKRVSEARQNAAQNELRMLELADQKNSEYYAKREALIQKETAARISGINAEIEILSRSNNDESRQKVLDLEAEKNKLLADQRVSLAEIRKEHEDIGKAASKAMQEAQAAAQLYIDTLKQNDFRTLAAFGMGDRDRALAERQNAEADRYAENMRDLQTKKGTMSEADYQAIAKSYKDVYDAALAQAQWFYDAEGAARSDWMNGFSSALANYTDSANNMAENVSTVFGTVTSGLEDAWVNFVTTGKLSFSDLARSVIADIARIQARAAISGLFNMFAGALAGGALGGAKVQGSSYTPAGGWSFATGGYTGHGGKFEPAGIVHRGEGVLNQEEMMKLGGVTGFYALRQAIARGYASGGVGGQAAQRVTAFGRDSSGISIVNQTQGRVDRAREVRLSDGERMLLLEQMEDRIANSWANPNSKNSTNFRKHVKAERVL